MGIYSLKNVNIYIYVFYGADSPTCTVENRKLILNLEQIHFILGSTSLSTRVHREYHFCEYTCAQQQLYADERELSLPTCL